MAINMKDILYHGETMYYFYPFRTSVIPYKDMLINDTEKFIENNHLSFGARAFAKKIAELSTVEEKTIFYEKYALRFYAKEKSLLSQKERELNEKAELDKEFRQAERTYSKEQIDDCYNKFVEFVEAGNVNRLSWGSCSFRYKGRSFLEEYSTSFENGKLSFIRETIKGSDRMPKYSLRITIGTELKDFPVNFLGHYWEEIE